MASEETICGTKYTYDFVVEKLCKHFNVENGSTLCRDAIRLELQLSSSRRAPSALDSARAFCRSSRRSFSNGKTTKASSRVRLC